MKKKFQLKSLLHGLAGFSYMSAVCVSAAPLTLSEVPLQATGKAEPNLMILLDSSGSMNQILEPDNYVATDTTWDSCASPIANSGTIRIRIGNTATNGGQVRFWRSDDEANEYTWSAIPSAGQSCFDKDETYNAVLYAGRTNGDWKIWQDGAGNAQYSGHFLNWYFSDSAGFLADNFGQGATQKPGTERRTTVAKAAASTLIDGLNNIRVGVAQFNSGDGSQVLEGLESINTARTNLQTTIDGIPAGGSTPLAESFESLGRYYIEGKHPQQLTMYPDTAPQNANGENIFNKKPAYADATDEPVAGSEAIQYYCQRSFIVGLTDGIPTSDGDISNLLDDYDNDSDVDESDNNESLDDVVNALYDIDLRPDLKDDDNEPVKNNITTYLVGFADAALANNQLMKDAGAAGGGEFIYASNAANLNKAFNEAIAAITNSVGTQASVAFNSTSLDTGSVIYSAKFDTADWSGELFARRIDPTSRTITTTLWEAGEQLANETSSSREIITFKDGDGVPFTVSALTDAGSSIQEQDLYVNASTGATDDVDQWDDRIAYLRGDTSKDALDGFRPRGLFPSSSSVSGSTKLLGDIVHSTPVYVGKPEMGWPTSFGGGNNSYEQYKIDQDSRTPMVYVGANDGLLHAFNANTGEEEFAYMPGKVFNSQRYDGAHIYTSTEYDHEYYVDLTPSVSDVYIDPDGGSQQDWRTVLIGGLRGGGAGYFALDITDGASITETDADDLVLWEFDGGDDTDRANLGYSYARAQVAKMADGQWAAIFGNGYNSENGVAGLFVVFIEEGADGSWDAGDWKFISTGEGPDGSGRKNGLSSPALIDSDGDFLVDRIYAGDLLGNMWAFDMSGNSASGWDVAGGEPLFRDAGEPITAAPLVARNTEVAGGSAPNVLVMFGTGQYLNTGDLSDDTGRNFYAVWDNGTVDGGTTATPTNLQTRTISESGGLRKITGDDVDWATQAGWKIGLNAGSGDFAGERVITAPSLRRNTLFFSTVIPNPQPCASSGTGWLMSIDFRTGKAGQDAVFDTNNDGEINAVDAGYAGILYDYVGDPDGDDAGGQPGESGFIGDLRCTPGSNGEVKCDDIDVGKEDREGRLSWEELAPAY
ncbi:pilus assembly protein [Biformimicrobium ophioploci]|uniref:PilC/PilY family type IV pilus protein n=1 Tax=Biformimicrobium ophioploci TaxID=3036711 RepID=A0ABQ6M2M6_9GAMM|nr:PilC/PilY family type IV pilus protein [Microbulbifer sp. NKW57]GMG88577.1 PilC/PilY family type IV pilus protein [Microbulbifer sp. NKW57]